MKLSDLPNIVDIEGDDLEFYAVLDPDGAPLSYAVSLAELKDGVAPARHICVMTRNASQTITPSTVNKIAFDTIATNSTSGMGSTVNGEITILKAGWYNITGFKADYDSNATVTTDLLILRVNGSNVQQDMFVQTDTFRAGLSVNTVEYLAVNDVVTLHLFQSNTTSANRGTSTTAHQRPKLAVVELR